MIVIFYFFIVLLLFVFPKSKAIQFIATIILFLLFAFNYDNADRDVYVDRYYFYYEYSSMTEPLYTLLMSFLSIHHLGVQSLMHIVALVFIGTIIVVVSKFSKNFGIALGGYMIACFFMDVVQVRFTLSLVFVYIGLWYHTQIKNELLAAVIYMIFILLSASVHASSFIFSLFLLARIKDKNKVITYTMILSCMLAIVVVYFAYIDSSLDFFQAKISHVGEMAEDRYNIKTILRRIFLLFLIIALFFFSYYLSPLQTKQIKGETFLMNYMRNINILSICFIPLLFFSADFHRLFYAIYIINLAIISRWVNKKNRFIINIAVVLTSFILLYALSLAGNKKYVFDAIFYKNLIL